MRRAIVPAILAIAAAAAFLTGPAIASATPAHAPHHVVADDSSNPDVYAHT